MSLCNVEMAQFNRANLKVRSSICIVSQDASMSIHDNYLTRPITYILVRMTVLDHDRRKISPLLLFIKECRSP